MPCENCQCGGACGPQPKSESLWVASSEKRAFPPLMRDTIVDVVIIGGGITGLTAAYHLKKAGKKVMVLEADTIGSKVTGYTTAHLTEALDVRYKKLLHAYGSEKTKQIAASQRAAIEAIAQVVERERIECDFRRVPGYLYATTEAQKKELEDEKKATDEAGLTTTLVDSAPLPFPTTGALRFENQAEFHPLKYIQALAKLVHGGGSFVFEHTRVEQIDKKSPHRFTTSKGTVTADQVIVATHVPIIKLLSMQMKLGAYQSYVMALTLDKPPIPDGLFWGMTNPYDYIRSYTHDGVSQVVVGGQDHRQGAVKGEPYKRLKKYITSHFPVASIDYQWSAQLFHPYDGLPYIGAAPGYDKVFIATGYSGNGMTGGTLAALLTTDLVLGKENAWEKLYLPSRITIKGFWKEFIQQQWFIGMQVMKSYVKAKPKSKLDELPANQGSLINYNGKTVAAYKNADGAVTLLSPICPHAGCSVQWNGTEKTWDCPCHGSRFAPMGTVIAGPASKDLSPLKS